MMEESKKKRILVVDDEPHMIRLLRLNLEPEGYEVFEASDGEQAYAFAVNQTPDLVVLDVRIPKRSGIEVCKAIKLHPQISQTPVILITGRGEGMRKAAMDSGADLFLMKPFSPLRLLGEIRRMAVNR